VTESSKTVNELSVYITGEEFTDQLAYYEFLKKDCFNILKLYILATECIGVFHMVLTINRDFFPKH
jgi:hypothetical protein